MDEEMSVKMMSESRESWRKLPLFMAGVMSLRLLRDAEVRLFPGHLYWQFDDFLRPPLSADRSYSGFSGGRTLPVSF
jgi:hypothetical protein